MANTTQKYLFDVAESNYWLHFGGRGWSQDHVKLVRDPDSYFQIKLSRAGGIVSATYFEDGIGHSVKGANKAEQIARMINSGEFSFK